jgi:hypothetical protein
VLRIGDEWIIYFDAYEKETYDAVATKDFKTFRDISDKVSFPKGHKHGTALRVDRKLISSMLSNERAER